MESKEQYYNRMGGIVTLYATLLQAEQVPVLVGEAIQMQPAQNGLGAPVAWAWLARLLNQQPQRITATLLLAFLKPCAHVLAARYKVQFVKLLRFIHGDYLTMTQTVVDAADGAQGADERAALAVLRSWAENTLRLLSHGKQLHPPDEAGMPDFKVADDTRDAGEDAW